MWSRITSACNFSNLCRLHAGIDILTGSAILYSVNKMATYVHGDKASELLFGKDGEEGGLISQNLLNMRVTESLVGLLLVDVGILLTVISTTTSRELQEVTCKAALGMHALMISWRLLYQRKVEAVRKEIPGQIIADVVMASTWAAYLFTQKKE